ncbi:hypothetical protein [Paenibacillus durus]|uniref:hypothetical protein n=1 Tax=Paenibacillus durus TaxID=44251 RepID=UPI000A5BCC1F|nr:hypothetical protein [Paenibacillus durus]
MKVIKTLKHPITSHHRMLDATLHVYQEALSFLITVIHEQFMDLESFSTQAVVTAVERLIHRTKHNPNPFYAEFDQRFYKFPSYFRRSAIAEAFGMVKSHHSRFEFWQAKRQHAQQEGKRFTKPPTLQAQPQAFPCLYKGNMFIRTSERAANIKVFHQGDWVWLPITFKGQDLFKRNVWSMKECSPTLVRKGKRYALHIAYEGDVKLTQTEFSKQRVCAVEFRANEFRSLFRDGRRRHCLGEDLYQPSQRKRPDASNHRQTETSPATIWYRRKTEFLAADERLTDAHRPRYRASNHRLCPKAPRRGHCHGVFRQDASA